MFYFLPSLLHSSIERTTGGTPDFIPYLPRFAAVVPLACADLEKESEWLDAQNQKIDSLDLTDLLDPDECPYNVDNLLEELMNAEDLDELHRLERCSTASSDRHEIGKHVRQPSTSAILQSTTQDHLDYDGYESSLAGSDTSEVCRRRSHTGTCAPMPVLATKTLSPSNSLDNVVPLPCDTRTASQQRACVHSRLASQEA